MKKGNKVLAVIFLALAALVLLFSCSKSEPTLIDDNWKECGVVTHVDYKFKDTNIYVSVKFSGDAERVYKNPAWVAEWLAWKEKTGSNICLDKKGDLVK